MEGNVYPLDSQLLVGRTPDADIQLLDEGVSRRHCTLIANDDGHFILVDLSSANGTQVGGENINRLRLLPGDVFSVGAAQLVLEEADGAPPPEKRDEIRLASGPAESDTDVRPPESVGCGNPLHVVAIHRKWAHCPNCGSEISEDESLSGGAPG